MTRVPYFGEALRVSQLAAFLELLMEPAFTSVQHNMLYGARAVAEGASVVLKTLTVFGLFFWAHSQGKDLGVLPFAVGEVVNSITLTIVYWTRVIPIARTNGFSLFPKTMSSRCVSPQSSKEFTIHSLILFSSLVLTSNIYFRSSPSLCSISSCRSFFRQPSNGSSQKETECSSYLWPV